MSTLVQLASAQATSSGAPTSVHPLEPLTAAEVARAVALLKREGKATPATSPTRAREETV